MFLVDALRGLTPYSKAWRWQRETLKERIASPTLNHRDYLVCLEHSPVYTLGRSSKPSDLLCGGGGGESGSSSTSRVFDNARQAAALLGIDLHEIERGGKVTYHGPGQLVVYPLLHLREPFFKPDLHLYVYKIEEVVIKSLAKFGLPAERLKGFPGVWVRNRKIAAVGMNCSKWYTSHGFALNVNPDLEAFRRIVPCGINDRDVTSLAAELKAIATERGQGTNADLPSLDEVKEVVLSTFCSEFMCDLEDDDEQVEKMMAYSLQVKI